MWGVLKPTKKKILSLLVLIVISAVVGYFILTIFTSCLFSLGCDYLSFGDFVANLFFALLIFPAYWFSGLLRPVLGHIAFFTEGAGGFAILGILELVYLYFIVCLLGYWFRKFKERKSRIVNPSSLFLLAKLWLPLIVILAFDVFFWPRQFSLLMFGYKNGMSIIFTEFSSPFRFLFFAVFEIAYVLFLIKNRAIIHWNRWLFGSVLVLITVFMLFNMFFLISGFTNLG